MAARTGSTTWTGDVSGGSGRLVVGPSRWEAGYSFRSRFTNDATGRRTLGLSTAEASEPAAPS